MRKFKLRYWDTKNKKFDTNIGVYLIGDVDLANTIPEGYEITQFTGLLDKNGKEIYEGDILSDGKNSAVVRWYDNDLCFILNDMREYVNGSNEEPDYIIDTTQGWVALEIIGNIYKNPELLK